VRSDERDVRNSLRCVPVVYDHSERRARTSRVAHSFTRASRRVASSRVESPASGSDERASDAAVNPASFHARREGRRARRDAGDRHGSHAVRVCRRPGLSARRPSRRSRGSSPRRVADCFTSRTSTRMTVSGRPNSHIARDVIVSFRPVSTRHPEGKRWSGTAQFRIMMDIDSRFESTGCDVPSWYARHQPSV